MSDNFIPAPITEQALDLLEKKSVMLSKSRVIPISLQGKIPDIMVILMIAHELNLPAMMAINGINVINGRPTISPQLGIAMIRRNFPAAYIKIEEGKGPTPSVSCTMARSKAMLDQGEGFTSSWNIHRAEAMGLGSKDNYKKQPTTMLRWRAVGEASRVIFPDVLSGLYFPDEMAHGEGGDVVDITPEGEVKKQIEDETAYISKEDQLAMVSISKERGWSIPQVKGFMMDKFMIGDSSKLNKKQYKELLEILNTLDPFDFAEEKR